MLQRSFRNGICRPKQAGLVATAEGGRPTAPPSAPPTAPPTAAPTAARAVAARFAVRPGVAAPPLRAWQEPTRPSPQYAAAAPPPPSRAAATPPPSRAAAAAAPPRYGLGVPQEAMAKVREQTALMREQRLRAELTARLGRPPTTHELLARATGGPPHPAANMAAQEGLAAPTTGAAAAAAAVTAALAAAAAVAAAGAVAPQMAGLDPSREKRLRAELTYRLGRPPTPTELEARATGRVGPLAPRAKAAEAQQGLQGYQGQYQAHRPCAPSNGIWKAAPPTAAAARRPPPPSQWKAAAPKPVVFRGAQAQVMRF